MKFSMSNSMSTTVLRIVLIGSVFFLLNACATSAQKDSAPVEGEKTEKLSDKLVSSLSLGLFGDDKKDEQQESVVKFTPVFNPVHGNVFDSMDYIGSEPAEFGLYTYVLFTQRPERGSPLYKKYQDVLEKVQAFPNWRKYSKIPAKWEKGGTGEHNINTKGLNIFLVPTRFIPAGQHVTMNEYEFDTAQVIINDMLNDIAGPIFREKLYGEGPYLFTLQSRLKELDKDFVLYTDLSDLGAEKATEVVSSYQTALLANEKSNIEPVRFAQNLKSQIGQPLIFSNAIIDQASPAFAGQ